MFAALTREERENAKKKKEVTSIVDINSGIIIIILNVSGLNTPIKRQILSELM